MFGDPEISYNKIICEECRKSFEKITSKHLKKHGLSISKYKEKWGYDKNQPLESLRIKEIRKRHTLSNGTIRNLEKGKNYQFKKGEKNRFILREQTLNRLRGTCVNVQSGIDFRQKQIEAMKRKWKEVDFRKKQMELLKTRARDKLGRFI